MIAVWLEIQCKLLPAVQRAAVVLSDAAEAHWSLHGQNCDDLLALARSRQSAVSAGSLTRQQQAERSIVLYGLHADQQPLGVVVFECLPGSETDDVAWQHPLAQGNVWLGFARQLKLDNAAQTLLSLIKLLMAGLQPDGLRLSALTLLNQIRVQLPCQSAALALHRNGRLALYALSDTARFDAQSQYAQTLLAAMRECADQAQVIATPAIEPTQLPPLMQAHQRLAQDYGVQALLSVPLVSNGALIGVLTLSQSASVFSREQLQLCQFLASLMAPVLELKRLNDRGAARRLREGVENYIRTWRSAGYSPGKLLSVAALALLLLLLVFRFDYRVTADAVLEGSVQRVVVSPIDGYIANAHVRPGDVVKQGAVLGSLDDKDIQLELLKWNNELQQHQRGYREAMALHDSAKIGILAAQIQRAEAQVALLNEKRLRTVASAPFDGVVIQGDLSQSLGAPVSRGDVLFKLAPLDDYRLILNVDERAIADIAPGQSGRLLLTSLPGEGLSFNVVNITPVSTAKDGRNYFRVEAQLEARQQQNLRPGMQGVGKIVAGKRSLLWLLTHEVCEWLWLTIWSHLP